MDSFYKHRSYSDGLYKQCKSCWNKYQSSPEMKAKRNTRNLKNETSQKRRDYLKAYVYKKKYGISVAEYNQMFAAQDGKCYICSKHSLECHNGLYVDHCHSDKKVRKLLCRDCNSGLGYFKDNASLLEKASRYLIEHK